MIACYIRLYTMYVVRCGWYHYKDMSVEPRYFA
jgi:hypothetical protein